MALVIVFILIVAIFGGIIYHEYCQIAEQRLVWRAAAKSLGIQFVDSGGVFSIGQLVGKVEGVKVRAALPKVGGRDDERGGLTEFTAEFPEALGVGLKITRQGFVHGIGKAFGLQDIEVGDAEFDDRLLIKGHHDQAVKALLTRPVRRAILHLFVTHPYAIIEDNRAIVRIPTIEADRGTIVQTVNLLVELWQLFEEAVVPRVEITAEDVVAAVPVALVACQDEPGHPPPIPPEREPAAVPVVEVAVVEDDEAEAAAATEDAPSEEELFRKQEEAEIRAAALAAVATRAEWAPSESAVEICNPLFKDGVSGVDQQARFAEFADREVQWLGQFRTSGPYVTDMHFGEGPGIKANFKVCDVSSGYGVSSPVTAVVQLSADAAPALAAILSGHAVRFRGRLLKFDGLLRELYIGDGELVAEG